VAARTATTRQSKAAGVPASVQQTAGVMALNWAGLNVGGVLGIEGFNDLFPFHGLKCWAVANPGPIHVGVCDLNAPLADERLRSDALTPRQRWRSILDAWAPSVALECSRCGGTLLIAKLQGGLCDYCEHAWQKILTE
jgi:hypothetical protein